MKHIKLFENNTFKEYVDDIFLEIQDKYIDDDDVSIKSRIQYETRYGSGVPGGDRTSYMIVEIKISTLKEPDTIEEVDIQAKDLEKILDITKMLKSPLKQVESSGNSWNIRKEILSHSYNLKISIYPKEYRK